MASTTLSSPTNPTFQNPKPNSSQFSSQYFNQRRRRSLRFSSTIAVFAISNGYNPTPTSLQLPKTLREKSPTRVETRRKIHPILTNLAASAILFVGLGARACSISSSDKLPQPVTAATSQTLLEEGSGGNIADGGDNASVVESDSVNMENHGTAKPATVEDIEDNEFQIVFEKKGLQIKKKALGQPTKYTTTSGDMFALTVPLRVVALRGSVPLSWIKEFVQSQGKRFSLQSEFRGGLSDIICDLTSSLRKGNIEAKSVMAADIVTVGDSWLSSGISKRLFQPIQAAEEQDWFKGLSEKWKVYLRRNSNGEIDSCGEIWAAPYRWGSMVIAYKTNKFQKHKLAPIEDWEDLWRPELAGKISMVDSPREVVGAILKNMGASYNSKDIDSQVIGGKDAVMKNLTLLQKQVRLFDSVNYLKSFGVGDVWVAVGWSSDIIPAAKRMSNVAVIVPKSGASLWADLWAIPAAGRFSTTRIGGRVRGPSPLIHQWIEFCLQAARALPFEQDVVAGASPLALENPPAQNPNDLTKNKPKLETNLIAGVPPPDILAKCEFLEPLSNATLMDYQLLIDSMQRPSRGLVESMKYHISSVVQTFRLTTQSS